MAAVLELQNNMENENEIEIIYVSSTNNEVTSNNGFESQLNSKEENVASGPSLESMGLQPEAEDDPSPETLNASKDSSKRKSEHKEKETFYCQQLLSVFLNLNFEKQKRRKIPNGRNFLFFFSNRMRTCQQFYAIAYVLFFKVNENVHFLGEK